MMNFIRYKNEWFLLRQEKWRHPFCSIFLINVTFLRNFFDLKKNIWQKKRNSSNSKISSFDIKICFVQIGRFFRPLKCFYSYSYLHNIVYVRRNKYRYRMAGKTFLTSQWVLQEPSIFQTIRKINRSNFLQGQNLKMIFNLVFTKYRWVEPIWNFSKFTNFPMNS